jgi:hypothetical protein
MQQTKRSRHAFALRILCEEGMMMMVVVVVVVV